MWLKWTIFCLGKRRTGTGFSLRGRRKKEKARGREKSAKKRENPLYPIPLFFPFLPIPYPFRRLLRAQANRIPLCNSVRGTWQWGRSMPGGGGGGVTPRNFWWGADKKSLFLHPFSYLLQRQKLRHHLTLESQQEDFLKSISNSHIALPMLLIWNWNDTTLMHSCSSI